MQRDKAVSVVKEIFRSCTSIEGESVKLLPSKADGVYADGCQIHIETGGDVAVVACIEAVAANYGLAVASEGERLIIYEPQTD